MKISVSGKLEIGSEMKLVETQNDNNIPLSNHVATIGTRLAGYEVATISNIAKPIDKIRNEYRLTETGKRLYIDGEGLTLQYGIFGTPGAGKTNLLMNILKQVAFYQCKNRNNKYGGLILDPKAALKDDVKAIFRQYGR